MKTLTLLCALVLLNGCTLRLGGKNGFEAAPVRPPDEAIISMSGRTYGVHIGQNPATQSPEAIIGIKSYTYTRVRTGSNSYAPPVSIGFEMDQSGFSTGIKEHLQTGTATEKPIVEKGTIRDLLGR